MPTPFTTLLPCLYNSKMLIFMPRKLWLLRIVTILVLLLGTYAVAAEAAPIPPPTFDHADGGTLYFKSEKGDAPKPLKTSLFDMSYLGSLNGDDATYFLFTAKPCQNCLQESGVYALKPTGGYPATFVFPGKIFDHKTRATVYESRAFFGKCLAHHEDVYLVFQSERIDRRSSLQRSVFIADPGTDHMNEKLIERNFPRIQDTLKYVKAKRCHEVSGRNRIMLSHPLDLKSRVKPSDEDSDAEEGTDEEDGTGDSTIKSAS